jgi:hypothetical protein
MLSLDAIIASGTTALGLALIFLWLLIREEIVPKGRLAEVKEQLRDCKDALKEALSVVQKQNDGVQPLVGTVKDLVTDVKLLMARSNRR